jgi:hypothetical protein
MLYKYPDCDIHSSQAFQSLSSVCIYARSWFEPSALCLNGRCLLKCLNLISVHWTRRKITKESAHRNHEQKKISFGTKKWTSAFSLEICSIIFEHSISLLVWRLYGSAVTHHIWIGSKVRKEFKWCVYKKMWKQRNGGKPLVITAWTYPRISEITWIFYYCSQDSHEFWERC